MPGIVAYGAYIPYHRLDRRSIAEALGTPPAKGTRAVASYDEDTTSLGVEAARKTTKADGPRAQQVLFATSSPAYLDKTNATAIHAALGLDQAAPAYDFAGSVRSGIGALRAGLAQPNTLVVLSDIRTGLPGGADESTGGDAAVAFLTGDGPDTIADVVAAASSTAEFLDRWRVPTETTSRQWEERFGEHAYVPLAEQAVTDALKQAGITADDVDHLVVAGTHARAARRFGTDELAPVIGNTGTAHPGLVLADALDRAEPGQTIALVTLADGADVLVLKVNRATPNTTTVRDQIEGGLSAELPYATFLTWRGQLRREPPRRPDPERPAAPPTFRSEAWKFGFTGSRCTNCSTRHLPPQRVCVTCQAVDQMTPERLADVPATIATFTVDRLAFSLSPPVVAAVVDFDGGGRFQCELTDVDPAAVKIGDRVEMTFRKLFTADGVHNYFWKAKPLQQSKEA